MFHARTLGRLYIYIGLCEILVKRILILCARVKSTWRCFGFFEFLKKMGENGEIVRFLWYFMVFRKRTYGELMSGLGKSLIFLWKVFTVPFKVIARNFRNSKLFGADEFLKIPKNTCKRWELNSVSRPHARTARALWNFGETNIHFVRKG